MLRKLFLDHPHAVGETYFEHQRQAMGFSLQLFAAAFACAVHALAPGLFVKTASRAITSLHARMVAGRDRPARGTGERIAA